MSSSWVWLFATPWNAARQTSLSFNISQSLCKLIFIESMMPSNHLILCSPLLLLPSVFPSIRVFSNESALCKSIGASASASVLQMNIQDWFPLKLTGLISLQFQGTLKSSPIPLFKSISSLVLSFLYGPTLTFMHDYQKNHSFGYTEICQQSNVSTF